jgi:SAM-dependent methyltransferase
MDLSRLQQSWHELGLADPRWAILSEPSRQGGKWDDEAFWRTGQDLVDWVATHLDSLRLVPPLGDALDFGCGLGRLTQALAKHFQRVVGVDIAASMVDAARAVDRSEGRVHYVHNQADDLRQFGDGSFDFVLSLLVLQHMRPDYAASYLREFVRVLRPGGVAFVQWPVEPLAPVPTTGAAAVGPFATCAVAATRVLPPQVAVPVGSTVWLRVEVENRGALPWRATGPGRVEVGCRSARIDGSGIVPPVWTALPHDVGPGATAALLVAVQAPPAAGHFVLQALPGIGRHWCEAPGNTAASCLALVAAAAVGPPAPAAAPPRARDRIAASTGPIEVYGTSVPDFVAVVTAAGALVVDLRLDAWAGPDWVSAHATLQKRG